MKKSSPGKNMQPKKTLPIVLLLCKDPSKNNFFKKNFKELYYIMEADDCESALDWIKVTPIDLIFLDFYSLDVPLVNFCIHIRAILKEKRTPIFLISQVIQKSFIAEALKAGVSDFIHEPLDALEVHERISVQLHSSPTNRKIHKIKSKLKPLSSIPQNTDLFFNRTLMGDKALRTIIETKKAIHPLSLFMVQIDHFVHLEKELGPLAILELVSQVEAILRSHLRPHDFLVTEGPATHLILLPKTSQRAAKIIAEDIRKDISSTTIKTSNTEILITASIGVIAFEKEPSESGKSFEQFELCLERVKTSLCQAQKKGNAVITAKSPS